MEIGFNDKPAFEYLENDPSSWFARKTQIVPEWFQSELTSLGGLNPHGKPNLVAVWAGTLPSDRAEKGGLKYHCGWSPVEVAGYRYLDGNEWKFVTNIDDLDKTVMVFPTMQSEELGLLRFVIEKWTSPQELEYQHRFSQVSEEGAQILRDFPRQGIYDTYFIVEDAHNQFRPLDRDVLTYLRFKWNFDKKPPEEQERIREDLAIQEQVLKAKTYRERVTAIVDGDLTLPKEEIEKREEYWERVHDYSQDVGRF